MLHIRPVLEEQASEEVKEIYHDIKKVFGVEIVPLVFQYLAGFEDYFLYVWPKIRQNVTSDYFTSSCNQLLESVKQHVATIYQPSRQLLLFVNSLHASEKEHIIRTVYQLEEANTKLLLLTLALREGVKGVSVGKQFLPRNGVDSSYEEEVFDQFINSNIMRQNLREQKEDIEPVSRMLAPLFGSQALSITKYPEFFGKIAEEMENLVKKESYLQKRVELEHLGLLTALQLPYPLGCTYQEIATFAGRKPYFDELLYILAETFPTRFPRLLITTAVMEYVLQIQQSSRAIVQ